MSSGFETNKITIVLHSFNFFGVLVLELARTFQNSPRRNPALFFKLENRSPFCLKEGRSQPLP